MHFTWNLTVSFESTAIIGFLFMIMCVIIIFSVFQFGVYLEGKTILRELTDESRNGVIPAEHLKYIPFTSRRYKRGWLQGKINQKDYVKTATRLALRKSQVKNLNEKAQKLYLREIENLRYKIRTMLYYAQYPA
jgi:hypothetical protein